MRIERSLAQSREMFAAAKHGGISQPAQKLARVGNHLLRIVRNRPRTHHLSRSLVGQIEHRRKIHVEANRAAVLADHSSMLADVYKRQWNYLVAFAFLGVAAFFAFAFKATSPAV